MSTFNAVIDSRNNVIGYTNVDDRSIEIAGGIALGGAAVNVETYRVSKSARNRAKICNEMPSTVAHEHNGRTFYTLEG